LKTVLYVCVHNAGRSQMAEVFTNKIASDRGLPIQGLSAGTVAGDRINPVAETAMEEIGVSMRSHRPKQITQAMTDNADRVITMGCGVDADACPARFIVTDDWGLEDPKDQPIEKVRLIRDEIRRRVEALLNDLESEA
jgi:arsenate reductase